MRPFHRRLPPGFARAAFRLACASLTWVGLSAACDKNGDDAPVPTPAASSAPPPPVESAAVPEPPRAPDIIVDRAIVSVGNDHVGAGDPRLQATVAGLLAGHPSIQGQSVDVVAMRNARPSQVEAVVAALHVAKASGVGVKTETRDGATVRLPVSFTKSLQDCATVAWIAKDAAIEVWPAGGGKAKRVIRGLAGPDMTLGADALRDQASGCVAAEVAVGAEDTMTWGLVFDLASSGLAAVSRSAAGARSIVLLQSAVPGRKIVIE